MSEQVSLKVWKVPVIQERKSGKVFAVVAADAETASRLAREAAEGHDFDDRGENPLFVETLAVLTPEPLPPGVLSVNDVFYWDAFPAERAFNG